MAVSLFDSITPARVFVLDTQTGVAVRSPENEGKPTTAFVWAEDGNSCNCNRELFWERGNNPAWDGIDATSDECTSGRYTVALLAEDGTVLWSDMPDGWAPPQ